MMRQTMPQEQKEKCCEFVTKPNGLKRFKKSRATPNLKDMMILDKCN